VATAFLPNLENKPYVCHKNDIKNDNRVENLYWGTAVENESDKMERGLRPLGEDVPACKISETKAIFIKKALLLGVSSTALARHMKIPRTTIHNIKYNAAWKWLRTGWEKYFLTP
jgi:hypothetical protein